MKRGRIDWVRLRLVAVALIWAGTFIAGRALSEAVEPVAAAFLRFVIASAALSAIMLGGRLRAPKPTLRHVLRLLILGFVGIFLYNLFFFEGLRHISASRATLIIALNPAGIALASFLFAGEQLDRLKLLGIGLGIAGVAIIVLGRDPAALSAGADAWRGDLAIFGCVFSWVTYSAFARPVIKDLGPLPTVFYSVLAGTAVLAVYALATTPLDVATLARYRPVDWVSLGFLGLLGSAVAYVWYYSGIGEIGAARAGIFISLNPVFGVILAALLLGETITLQMLCGGALAVSGVYLCNRPQSRRLEMPSAQRE
jgi:drug/metabolite transporter (DMT)-like permease